MTQHLSAIGYAVHKALIQDLEPVKEYRRIWSFEENKQVVDNDNPVFVRPHEGQIQVYSFPQSFSDTSLGFGGIAGQAFTTAQVTVVICGVNACVYVNSRLAHNIHHYNRKFWDDLLAQYIQGKMQGKKAYEENE